MIDGVDTSRIDPSVDDGADREKRILRCTLRPWCVMYEHSAHLPCTEAPRVKRDVSDPLPSLRSPSFTAQLRKANGR